MVNARTTFTPSARGELPPQSSVSFGEITIGGMVILFDSYLTEISFPNLLTATTAGSAVGFWAFTFLGLSVLKKFLAPLLESCSGGLVVSFCVDLVQCDFSSLATINNFQQPTLTPIPPLLIGNTALTTLDFPLLSSTDGGSLPIQKGLSVVNNLELTSITIPSLIFNDTGEYDFSNNALNVLSVNAILAQAVASAGFISGSLDLSGGTNAAPTGQGITDSATLTTRGVTVTTN